MEPPKPPLMPQNMPAPQPPPAVTAAAASTAEGDAARRATTNYSPPQAAPRPMLAPTAVAAMAAPQRAAGLPAPVHTAHIAQAPTAVVYQQQAVQPVLPSMGAHAISGEIEYYDHDLPDA